jgi:phage tail sheath protein FI
MDEDITAVYGLVKLGDDIYYQSLHIAALMSTIDTEQGQVPSESPSNKNYKMDGLVIKMGTDYEKINLDLTQANYLNENGIVTALNFINGWTAWGNFNTCYPSNTDVKDMYIPVKRMFKWAANTLILSTWQFVDRKFTNVLRDSINLTVEDWLKGMNGTHLYGSSIALREEDNSLSDMQKGKFTWHIDMSPILPLQAQIYEFEYNLDYLQNYYS